MCNGDEHADRRGEAAHERAERVDGDGRGEDRALEVEGKRGAVSPLEEPTDDPIGIADPATFGKEVVGTTLEDVAEVETQADRLREAGLDPENPPKTLAEIRKAAQQLKDKGVSGKPLSFNNLNDLSAARLLALELDGPACVIVKHANPCGVGVADTLEQAYEKALASDPVSAFGGVVVMTHPVSAALGERLGEIGRAHV